MKAYICFNVSKDHKSNIISSIAFFIPTLILVSSTVTVMEMIVFHFTAYGTTLIKSSVS